MSALTKLKDENEAIKDRNRLAGVRKKLGETRLHSQVSGLIGGSISAAGCAIVDAKRKDSDKPYATFGETPIPINASVGAVALVAGLYAAKKHPVLGMFAFVGGAQAIYCTIYAGTKEKVEKYYEENPE